ncbi:response regulator [Roseivivax marinus]|uniref:response regulator n=1 Tax=Roseivivax marinus TaxID=1379903 RepID=UPI001F04FEE8|nr:response regulator [Roseivivax marinus]UMA65324.1 response regulator [Roseivivax marinus]
MTGRILIVDGIATQRIILRVKLATACYDVAQAATGAEARAQIARGGIDLVIVAERLPDTDAATFCAGLRGPFAPGVIVLMDQADPAGRLAALRAGAEDTLVRRRSTNRSCTRACVRSCARARPSMNCACATKPGARSARGQGLRRRPAISHRPRVAVVHARDAVSPALLSALRGSLGADLHAPRRDEVLRGRAGRFDVFVLIAADAGGALDFLGDLRVRHDGRTTARCSSWPRRRNAARPSPRSTWGPTISSSAPPGPRNWCCGSRNWCAGRASPIACAPR